MIYEPAHAAYQALASDIESVGITREHIAATLTEHGWTRQSEAERHDIQRWVCPAGNLLVRLPAPGDVDYPGETARALIGFAHAQQIGLVAAFYAVAALVEEE